MNDKAWNWFLICAVLYALVFVLCFGPATVQSERERDKHRAECRAQFEADRDRQALCLSGGPMMSDGLPKSLFWPLWLSYTVAAGR